jgi:hypothetical protein
MPAPNEKVNYALVILSEHPEALIGRVPDGKGYVYEDLVWEEENDFPMPSKSYLEAKWDEIKRNQTPWKEVFAKRDALLKESDVYALPDFPHATEADRTNWLNYRKALRDFPTTAVVSVAENGGAIDANFPTKPA